MNKFILAYLGHRLIIGGDIMQKINCKIEYGWLQISDLHIFDNTEWKMMEEAYGNLEYKQYVKFILITGDLHNFGENYNRAKIFLEKLLQLFDLRKKDLFIIPGNHDAANCSGKMAYTYFIENEIERDQDCYREYFVEGKLVDCFNEYNMFIQDFYGNDDNCPYENPEQVNVRNWNGKINIIHLNTAINCNGDNTLKQIVDIYNLSNLGSQLKNCPSIVIGHHPLEMIHTSHEKYLVRYMTDWKVSAYMCGDLHKENKRSIELFSGNYIPEFICGKASPEMKDSYSDLGCILYLKPAGINKVKVLPYKWNSDKKRFDYYNGFDIDSGTFEFDLIYPQFRTFSEKRKEITGIRGESIWLPDAEIATGSQARFDTFTSTKIVTEYLNNDANLWGICAVKGVGKTFVLQIKRAQMSNKKICLPIGIKPSASNNWATDTVLFQSTKSLASLKNFNNVILFWKYSIIVYVINQLINRLKDLYGEDIEEVYELKRMIEEWNRNGKICKDTYQRCMDETYNNLYAIVKNIITDADWVKAADSELDYLCLVKHKISKLLSKTKKISVALYIDKVDQSIQEVNAEPPVDCAICEKSKFTTICENPNKSQKYCLDKSTLCKSQCCYGCETYIVPPNMSLRVHSSENGKYRHINIWQYLQLGLLVAVSQIRTDFEGKIEVNYTIRKEALACEENLLGQHSQKILNTYFELYYSKDEQEKIFCQCIKNQDPKYLFDASLAGIDGREAEAFVGVSTLCHPYNLALSETVFESIYRHSFDRARDIQMYGAVLTAHLDEIRKISTVLGRGEKVKELIEETAAELAFNNDPSFASGNTCYYFEKMSLLPNFWAQTNNFKRLMSMIEKNLMFVRDIREICKKFNGIKICKKMCKTCPAIHHPFSMLYKLGMLGVISINSSREGDVEQQFLHSKKVTYITGNDLLNVNDECIYILHPALTKSIDKLQGKKIMHFNAFILGKGMKVPQDKLQNLVLDYKKLKKIEFENKYYSKERKIDITNEL